MPSTGYSRPQHYLRLAQIVAPHGLLPLSASTWWRLVRSGRVSPGLLLSPRVRAWRLAEVLALAGEEIAQ